MIVNKRNFFNYTKENNINVDSFFEKVHWSKSEIEGFLFQRKNLNESKSKLFIEIVGAKEAMNLINWRAMNVKRPKYKEIFCNNYAY